jgi:hypothetical protein
MELHPISFNDHKPLLLMRAGKADSPIESLSLFRIPHGDGRNDGMKDWLTRWCGCHVVLFLSYLHKDKGGSLHVRRAKELDKNKTVCLSSPAELPPLSAKSMP